MVQNRAAGDMLLGQAHHQHVIRAEQKKILYSAVGNGQPVQVQFDEKKDEIKTRLALSRVQGRKVPSNSIKITKLHTLISVP